MKHYFTDTGVRCDDDDDAAEHKAETGGVAELQTIIRSAAAELGDKVAELQRQDKLVRDLQAQQVTAARDNSLCPDM